MVKSSFCSADRGCVEVSFECSAENGCVILTDTKGNSVTYTDEEWNNFIKAVRAGEFDVPSAK